MAVSSTDNIEYHPTVLAQLLHSLPHLNVSCHRVNSTFNPQSDIYLESLGILSSIPAAWLILTLAALLLYLATRCCDQHSTRRKPRSLTAPRLALAAAALLCAAATGLGLYANDDLHNGIVQSLTSARNLNNIISNVRNQTKIISTSLTDAVFPQLTELSDIFDNPVANQTALAQLVDALQSVRQNNTLAIRATADIQRPLANLDMSHIINTGDRWELYRWAGAMGILSGLLALCAVVLVGAARRSRRCLVLASVLALVSAAIAWLLSSVGLAAAVALADLCVGPEQYAGSVVSQKGLPPELLYYYTRCESVRANPFTQRLRESQQALNRMRVSLGSVSKIALDLFKNRDLQPKLSALTIEANSCDRGLASLTALLDCRAIHAQWMAGTRGLCVSALPGLALLLLATATAGLLLSILVCLASHTWIYLRKRRDYSQVDETDPFLPAPAASQAVAARTLQGGMAGAGTLPRGPPHHHRSQGDGCDTSRHTPETRLASSGGHLAHLSGSHSHHRGGHSTLGRLPSHASHHDHHINLTGPNNGKYATLSKQCKTLESSDFY
ncbi:protein tweety isoform X3 [Chrysoperla carnea]|uniref:protein tweety isoform X3 n=1 Tax=Chrysoperla carnea TaxID=189513 RepID=UPI001D090F29|nr:protein tweety isoform X3 [Chrysoperla carnea]